MGEAGQVPGKVGGVGHPLVSPLLGMELLNALS